MTILKAGSKGEEVKALQAKLVQLGFALKSDGVFGPKTEEAVQTLQSVFGYDVDGKVGPATLQLADAQAGYGFKIDAQDAVKRGLDAQGKKDKDGHVVGAELARTLKHGLEGPDVTYLQRRLVALGVSLSVDGKFGPATVEAVKQVQKTFGYDVDGVVGPATHALINAQIGAGYHLSQGAPKLS